jgi:phage internal scaffolding protein
MAKSDEPIWSRSTRFDKVFVRSPYNYDMDAVSDETSLVCKDASLAKQSFAEESDINTLVRRFGLTGELPTNVRMPSYGDFTIVSDFHSAMNAVAQANEAFDAMPALVRARFDNDPGKFVDFCADDSNRAEAEKLGLVSAEAIAKAAELAKAAVVPAPVAPAVAAPAVPGPVST